MSVANLARWCRDSRRTLPVHNALMMTEVFLEPVPDADISLARCSICKEQFHSSPVGPRKCMKDFPQHARERHPEAALNRSLWELFRRRDNR